MIRTRPPAIARFLRSAFALDLPGLHLDGRQLAFATVVVAAAAAFWAIVSGRPLVAWLTFGLELYQAWVTPRAEEQSLRRAARAFVAGGFWAAVVTLLILR